MNRIGPSASSEDNSAHTRQTFLYFGSLTLFLYLATPIGYLIDIPTSFMLKNQLGATAEQISTFRLVTAIPVYFAFAFGLIRDVWNPFGLRDRGYFLIFAPATAIVFVVMAFSPVSYRGLYVGMFVAMLLSRFIAAAYQGLMALVGQEKLMSGRLTVLWQIVSSVPYVAGGLASGYISDHLDPKDTFLLFAGLVFCLGLLGFWKPRSVFSHAYDKPQAKGTNLVGDVKRLVKHRAIYPAVLIMFLWSFAPGSNTPLQFYLTNELHASDAVYSYFNAIFAGGVHPDIPAVWIPLQESGSQKTALVGNDHRGAADDSAGVHSLGQPRPGISRADRLDGRHRHGGILRSGHAVLSAGLAGNLDDAGRRRICAGCPRRRPVGLEDLQQQSDAWIPLLRHCHNGRLCADPAFDPPGAERIDRHCGRRAKPES